MSLLRRFWWLAASLAVLIAALVVFGRPASGDAPLADGPLKRQAVALLQRAGTPGVPIVIRPSDGRPCGSGTVTGLGARMHIVLGAGSLDIPNDQALWAIAHESRHVRTHDPLLGVVAGWLWITLAVGAASEVTRAAVQRRGRTGWLALPLTLAVVWAAGLPVFNLIQRQRERGADYAAAVLVGGGPGAAFLAREGACWGFEPDPGLFTRLFLLNHPTTGERLRNMGAAGG